MFCFGIRRYNLLSSLSSSIPTKGNILSYFKSLRQSDKLLSFTQFSDLPFPLCYIVGISSSKCPYFSSIYNLKKMQNPKRSSRSLNSCLHCPNIFQNRQKNAQLISHIPQSILKKIGKGSTISCSQVTQMPSFVIVGDEEEEVRKCIMAMEYQLTWHSELLQPQFQMEKPTGIQEKQDSMKEEIEMFDIPFCSANEPNITGNSQTCSMWENRYFLQRLNQFLAADPLQAKETFPTDEFLEK